jgi:2-dehydro-3-deoxygluconokinase
MTLTTVLSLWNDIGGQAKAQEVNRELAKYVDVMIGNEEDFHSLPRL